MSTTATLLSWAVLAGIALAISGVIGLVVALRGRRIGSEPHCARCGYLLHGLQSPRCPECGTELTAQPPVLGVRRRSPWRLAASALLLLMGVAALTPQIARFVRSYDFYRHRPTAWVIDDLESALPGSHPRAWGELMKREPQLHPEERDRLIEMGLKHQQGPPGEGIKRILRWMGDLAADEKLTEAQRNRLFLQAFQLELITRRQVSHGKPIGGKVTDSSTFYSTHHNWKYLLGVSNARVGSSVDRQPIYVGGLLGSSGGAVGLRVPAPCVEPGHNRVEVDIGLTVTFGNRTIFTHRQTMHSEIEILPPDAPSPISYVNAPEMAETIRGALSFQLRRLKQGSVQLKIDVNSPPIDLAFTAFVRNEHGTEVKLDTFHAARGKRSNWSLSGQAVKLTPHETLTLILRTDRDTAERVIDLAEVWDGEIIVENVPVEPGR